jgi:hypothetical protein
LPDFVQAVSASTVTTVATTAAGAEALLACDGLEALLISTEGNSTSATKTAMGWWRLCSMARLLIGSRKDRKRRQVGCVAKCAKHILLRMLD